MADLCAKREANSNLTGPEPYSGLPWSFITANMKKWMYDERNKFWYDLPGLEHSKLFIGGHSKRRSENILKLNRKEIKLVTGFLSDHYPVRAKLKLWKLKDDDKCRFCSKESETVEHLLCHCESLENRRFNYFGTACPNPTDYVTTDIPTLAKFLRKLKLWKAHYPPLDSKLMELRGGRAGGWRATDQLSNLRPSLLAGLEMDCVEVIRHFTMGYLSRSVGAWANMA